MGKGKKKVENNKVLVAEFRVSMHCNECERSVAKAISKVKGVEMFMTNMPGHRVVVRGRINGEKVVKKIRKKAGKRAEILNIKEAVEVDGEDDDNGGGRKCSEKKEEERSESEETSNIQSLQKESPLMELDPSWDSEVYRLFSDENPNACSIM